MTPYPDCLSTPYKLVPQNDKCVSQDADIENHNAGCKSLSFKQLIIHNVAHE